jgi:UDP-glucose 4-epimerase
MRGKKIFVLGGTGSLGLALIRRLVRDNELLVFSRDEAKHWTIRNQMPNPNLKFAVGDMRDYARVAECLIKFRPNIIVIAAALKQVDTCELSPYESIQTNIIGVKNTIDAVERNMPVLNGDLETVVMVSTDKACAPVNVYGMCKAIAERMISSRSIDYSDIRFVGVRYGNVLDSRGSIFPLFRRQAIHGDAFTLTHPEMTRFLMTLDESIDLILHTAEHAKSGEIWLPKLRSMRIKDLVDIFSAKFQKPVRIIGMRPGEKLHEALISEAESPRVTDVGTHFVLAPGHLEVKSDTRIFSYTSSDDIMTKKELNDYLLSIGILERDISEFPGKQIEEIRTSF